MEVSLVYRNIHFYRLIMNLIYAGRYNSRYQLLKKVIDEERPLSVIEFCFGDVKIADYCKEHNIKWKGYDLNPEFVRYAKEKGFDAHQADIMQIPKYDDADMFIISGSLYHFNTANTEQLFSKVFNSTNKFLISEPIKNLSDSKGLIGYIARRSADAGKGEEHFRYNQDTFKAAIAGLCKKFNLISKEIGFVKKDMVVLVSKKEG